MSDYCIVCAEHLEFTAYGPCGHKDTCSKCVVRLRTVLKDERCVYCQQPSPQVFVTRYAGDYTKSLPKEAFDSLDGKGYVLLKEAAAYFDDGTHCNELKKLCSFSHPLVQNGKKFNSIKALQQELRNKHNVQFCPICLEGRKVFISEQLVYTKSQLNKHMKNGDDEGPMSTFSGFKGHPECMYCNKRFYSDNEQYEHMHRTHEECFLCKRVNPHSHVYYENYASLEDHFKQEHHMCTSQTCLDKKFVVFASEQELKTHLAREHGGDLTKAERKQALSVPVGFHYDRPGASFGSDGFQAARRHERNRSDGYLSGRSRNSSRSSLAMEEQISRAELASDQMPGPSTFTETDFPSMSTTSTPASGGLWLGSAHQKKSSLGVEDFPALPGTSKSAKKRAAKKKNLASVVGRQQEPRVIIASNADRFPALSSSTSNPPVPKVEGASATVSNALRIANEKLADRIQRILRDKTKYDQFRRSSASWISGALSTSEYHKMAISLGLANVIPDIAATCTDANMRDEILQFHSISFNDSASPSSCRNWVPPEVAALSIKDSKGAWSCGICSLINAKEANLCEACGSIRVSTNQQQRPREDEYPALAAGTSKSSQSTTGHVKSGTKCDAKKGKQSLSDFYKNTVHPQNPWRNPNLRGEWASKGAGQLAQRERALKDALTKKR